MNEIIKAYDFAEKEIKREKEEALRLKVKEIVKSTLEKIDGIDKQEKELAEQKKVLKKDIDDLKAGRLDLIEERQKESSVARNNSLLQVIHLDSVSNPPMYYYTYNGTGGYLMGWQTSNWSSGTYNINGIIKYL